MEQDYTKQYLIINTEQMNIQNPITLLISPALLLKGCYKETVCTWLEVCEYASYQVSYEGPVYL